MEQLKQGKPNRRVLRGTVVKDKMVDTVTVQVTRTVPHSKYNKFIKRSSRYQVHAPGQAAALGDSVAIIESRPMSKMKRWRLKEVVSKAL
jgi:small subunit ribosomal protein S17